MDDSNETGGPLGSSSFFGRISAGHCDMDNIALSPSTSDYSPYLYVPIRKSSLRTINQVPEANPSGINTERRNSRKESTSYSPKRKLSNLAPSNHQSFDNLQQLIKENQHGFTPAEFDVNNVTQSLPSSPHGSPKSEHHFLRDKKISADEIHCSVPWYYSGFIAAHHAPENSSPLVCTSEEPNNKIAQPMRKTSDFFPGMSFNSKFTTKSGQINRQRKFTVTNRDMNFLAPTSM